MVSRVVAYVITAEDPPIFLFFLLLSGFFNLKMPAAIFFDLCSCFWRIVQSFNPSIATRVSLVIHRALMPVVSLAP